MEKPTKSQLLKYYEGMEPQLFIQYDGSDMYEQCEHPIFLDDDGHELSITFTYELMARADVRVQIDPNSPRDNTLMLLSKIMEHFKKDETVLVDAKDELQKHNRRKELTENLLKEKLSVSDAEYLIDKLKEVKDV